MIQAAAADVEDAGLAPISALAPMVIGIRQVRLWELGAVRRKYSQAAAGARPRAPAPGRHRGLRAGCAGCRGRQTGS